MLGLREVPGQCLASRESLSISVPRLLVVPIDYGNANGRRRGGARTLWVEGPRFTSMCLPSKILKWQATWKTMLGNSGELE